MTTILSMMYTNELIVTLLNPIKAIHTDWHISVLHRMLNISFETYDKEVINEICITERTFDYIPTIEVNISVQNMNTAVFLIILNINVLITYVLFKYYRHITVAPSLYKKEMYNSIGMCLTETSILCLACVYAHHMWAFMYFNISLHNYNELNFYEFDVDFDMHEYIKKLVLSLYIHMLIMNISQRHVLFMILTLCLTIEAVQYFEIIYYIIIWITIIKAEKNTWKKVTLYSKLIKYLKENYIVRIHRNNK